MLETQRLEQVYVFSEMYTFWQRILCQAFSEPSTEEDVVLRALGRFDGEEAEIRRDVEMFMKESLEKQVLMEVD